MQDAGDAAEGPSGDRLSLPSFRFFRWFPIGLMRPWNDHDWRNGACLTNTAIATSAVHFPPPPLSYPQIPDTDPAIPAASTQDVSVS